MIKKLVYCTAAAALSVSVSVYAAGQPSPFVGKALEIFKMAVSMRTAKGHEQVPKLAHYLAAEFRAGGFAEDDIHLLPMGETAALVVRYRGDGSAGKKPILLSAHMDVVDALPKDWQRDPFTLIEEDGYFYGRGVSDDKQGVTALTTAFLRLKAEGFVPGRDLIIAFSGDEETGMSTTDALITEHRDLIDAEFVLVADSGGGSLNADGSARAYLLQLGEKNYVDIELTITNPGGHSSMPRPDNAIYELADALKKIQSYRFPLASNALTRDSLRAASALESGDTAAAMRRYADNPNDSWAIEVLSDSQSEILAYLSIKTTCVATQLKAGHAPNALPQSATANINCRIFPGESVGETIGKLTQVVANDAVQWKALQQPHTVPASALRDNIAHALARAVRGRYPDTPVIAFMAPWGTEGNHYRAAGIPAYGIDGVFMAGDSHAHGENERISVAGFYGNLEHWYTLITELAR